ncbi:MAG: ribonuclease domain-containing protein [Niabella sp.]
MNLKKIARDNLPKDLREPFRQLLHEVRNTPNRATVFHNAEKKLPNAGTGNNYYEYDVGEDRFGGRGRFRLVALLTPSGELLSAYFTSDHYDVEWTEITW